MRNKWIAAVGLLIAAIVVAACGSSKTASSAGSTSSPTHMATHSPSPTATSGAASASTLKSAKVGGSTVVTDAKGFTTYWFAPDTPTTSKCNGSCATFWPAVKGPATAGSGVTGKLGTIKRSDGATQATYNGHPLYTYVGDHSPGQATGNGLNVNGGLWHEVTVSGSAPAASKSAKASPPPGY
jgi:predicted lipoprotein with Yx(FWY)xxD motif